MNVVLLGPPGAGKGTQAKFVSSRFSLDHISSGDLLRDAVKKGTALGKKVKSYMDVGALVPDSLVINLIKDRIRVADSRSGFLLDGFPRTVEQARSLKNMLIDARKRVSLALNIKVSDEVILKRLSGRRICKNCGQPFNIFYNLPNDGNKCDVCGGELIQRDDDTIATIRERLETYKVLTEPLLAFYENEGILANVNGDNEISRVTQEIDKLLQGGKF